MIADQGFSKSFAWQRICERWHLPLSFQFEIEHDAEVLRSELDAVLADFQPQVQHGKYHDGGWKAVGLVAANGDWSEDRLLPGAEYKATQALDRAPRMREIIDNFPGEKRRVRLMNLKAGKSIFWHYDRTDSMDIHTARVHIPIVTSPDVRFQICHENHSWKPGEVWYGDFTFPHRLYNAGAEDRIHLVLDIIASSELESAAPESFLARKKERRILRRRAQSAFHRWCLVNHNGSPRVHFAGWFKTWIRANESIPA